MHYNKMTSGKNKTTIKTMNMKYIVYIYFILFVTGLISCSNDTRDFDNFDYQSVYFSYQFPVRTITFGEDEFDNTLDNEGKFRIYATTGGVYESNKDVFIDFVVDNTLTADLLFEEGGVDILPLPLNYYELSSNKITISEGGIVGSVDVQLTDAFFNDPLAIKNNYVLPVRMTNVINADTILSGKTDLTNPNRSIASDWSIAPKDFTLYGIKYVNQWHGNYLRRGKDIITGKNGNANLDKTKIRHGEYVEDDEVKKLETESMTQVFFPLKLQDEGGNDFISDLILTFDDNGDCTVSAAQSGYTATGTGSFIKKGAIKAWGNKDRDVLYLDYEIDHQDIHVVTKDTLVIRDRAVGIETYTPVLK